MPKALDAKKNYITNAAYTATKEEAKLIYRDK